MGREKAWVPKYRGLLMGKDGAFGPAVYRCVIDVPAERYGVSIDATNREMVEAVFTRIAERAKTEACAEIAADLRAWAEQGGDPWIVHVADEVAAGRRPETDNNDGAEGREGGCDVQHERA